MGPSADDVVGGFNEFLADQPSRQRRGLGHDARGFPGNVGSGLDATSAHRAKNREQRRKGADTFFGGSRDDSN